METKSAPSSFSKQLLTAAYLFHLVLIAFFTTCILFQHTDLIRPSITLAMLIIYGYLGVWVLLVSFFLILFKRYENASIVNRIVVKLLIFFFPLFGVLSLSKDADTMYEQVKVFILYMVIVTILLIVYQLVSCLCYEQRHPEFLFQQNDLSEATAKILEQRNQYNQNMG